MLNIFLALLAGIACGAVFSLVKLPIPAPQNIEGVIGILGIFLGYAVVSRIISV